MAAIPWTAARDARAAGPKHRTGRSLHHQLPWFLSFAAHRASRCCFHTGCVERGLDHGSCTGTGFRGSDGVPGTMIRYAGTRYAGHTAKSWVAACAGHDTESRRVAVDALICPQALTCQGRPASRRASGLARPSPEDAGIGFQRPEWLAPVSPFRRLFEGDVIARLAPGAGLKQCAGDVHHPTRARTFKEQGRPACRAKAARGVLCLVFESNDALMAEGDTKPARPDAHVGRISSTVRKLGRPGVVVPCPECRIVDLQSHPAAGTLGRYRRR